MIELSKQVGELARQEMIKEKYYALEKAFIEAREDEYTNPKKLLQMDFEQEE